jgi:2-iminobutanoate/2-iminopropanoate deaminase
MSNSRRDFITAAGVGASFGIFGLSPAVAFPTGSASMRRRVVGGSPYPTFSRAVEFDRVMFVAGVLGQKPGTRDLVSPDFEPQARQVMENLKASVEAAGSSMSAVLKCTCFLTDAADFAAFNKVYLDYFPKDPPARTTVIVKALVVENAKVEVDCVTCLDDRLIPE